MKMCIRDIHGPHASGWNRDPANPDWRGNAGGRDLRRCGRGCVPGNAGAQAGAWRRSGEMKLWRNEAMEK